MEKKTITTRKPFRDVGGPISNEQFRFLTEGFKKQHPSEQHTVFISKETILETLRQVPDVAGIRFNYGINDGADPTSRTIILVPCLDESTDRGVPNFLFLQKGYLNSEGGRMSSNQCWELFARYVDRMAELLPGVRRNEIPRGYFFGTRALQQLVNDENAVGILFQFGYDPNNETLGLRYMATLMAVDHHFVAFDPPFDTGNPCPPAICTGFDIPLFGKLLPLIESGSLIEMHHYALPGLMDALMSKASNQGDPKAFIEMQFAECLSLAQTGNSQAAVSQFRESWDGLAKEYLNIS